MARPLPYVIWPRDLCAPSEWTAGYNPQDGGGDQLSLSGRFHTSSVGRGIWQPSLSVFVHENRNYEAWLGLEAQISGRDMPVLVPYYPGEVAPFLTAITASTYSDGATFSDGSRFAGFRSRTSVASNAEAGAVFIDITKEYCGDIQSGHVFSIGPHLYRVRFVEEQTEISARVEVHPDLRADIVAGDIVEFNNPVVKCRLTNPQAFAQAVAPPFTGNFTLQFIEDTSPTFD